MLHCIVNNCNVTQANKTPGIFLHPFPQSVIMRKQWQALLKDKCNNISWNTSKICSKHFEMKYFDSTRRLKNSAIPTKFNTTNIPATYTKTNTRNASSATTKLDLKIHKLSQKQLHQDIKESIDALEEPSDLQDYVSNDLEMSEAAPMETQLWFIIKKQNHLIKKLMDSAEMYKSYASNARKELELIRTSTKENEKNLETQKYLVKTLQEKQATLEEQIEIITAVESRKLS